MSPNMEMSKAIKSSVWLESELSPRGEGAEDSVKVVYNDKHAAGRADN